VTRKNVRGGGGRRGAGRVEALSDIIKREIRGAAGRRRKVDGRVRAKWEEVVGAEIASHTAVISFARHVLRVRVDSSALLSELSGIYRKELVAAMAEGKGPVSLRTIEFELVGAAGPG
jgi:predicted nucleic acid-binding Zn ribbon protein